MLPMDVVRPDDAAAFLRLAGPLLDRQIIEARIARGPPGGGDRLSVHGWVSCGDRHGGTAGSGRRGGVVFRRGEPEHGFSFGRDDGFGIDEALVVINGPAGQGALDDAPADRQPSCLEPQ